MKMSVSHHQFPYISHHLLLHQICIFIYLLYLCWYFYLLFYFCYFYFWIIFCLISLIFMLTLHHPFPRLPNCPDTYPCRSTQHHYPIYPPLPHLFLTFSSFHIISYFYISSISLSIAYQPILIVMSTKPIFPLSIL